MIERFGDPIQPGAASFRCAACGEMAASVRTLVAGTGYNMGPPVGVQSYPADGIIVDYFLGASYLAADQDRFATVHDVLSGPRPDPADLRRIQWELAPFYCRVCRLNYCKADWHPQVVMDEGFYDFTEGHCPAGHQQTIDD